jgi:hypothetical protein
MPIQSPDIISIIDNISEHYKNNINNRFIRKALLTMELDSAVWGRIEKLTDEHDVNRLQGYKFFEMYEMILAFAKFIFKARTDVLPSLRLLLGQGGTDSVLGRERVTDQNDKILRDIAISNFGTNLSILSDLVHKLYMRTIEIDKEQHSVKAPVFERIPELKSIGQQLIQE